MTQNNYQNMIYRKSFLKWAGSKRQMLPIILPLLNGKRRLVEPFAGSAVVALNVNIPALVADTNRDLIGLFKFLQTSDKAQVALHLRHLFTPHYNHADQYYELRKLFNAAPPDSDDRIAAFLYLNRHGFNGLCRYNKSGEFNVPFGSYANPGYPAEAIETFMAQSQRMKFWALDFRKTFQKVKAHDVVFCDPPYSPLTETANFAAFGSGGFGRQEHMELAMCAKFASTKGARVIITNHDTAETRELYSDADRIMKVQIRRSIAASAGARKSVGELLAIYG